VNQEPNQFAEQSRQAKEATRKLRRRMIIVLICMAVFAVIALPLISYLEFLEEQPESPEIVTKKPSTIIFYEPDWDLDIMKEAGYLAKDRSVYFCDARYGYTEVLTEKNKDKYGPAVSVLNTMIDCIIRGDHEGYNALLSANYLNTEGNEPEAPFTMQQLYDIKLTLVAEGEKSENGKTYTQYEFEVEYRIRHNNGTFRTDIDEDESRKQYFVLSDSTSKDVLIDQIIGYVYKG
jgi:hypothetical protein